MIFPVKSWEDVAALFTIASVPFVVGSLLAAFTQIKAQADISRRELSFNGLIAFNEKFERSSEKYQSAKERFDNNDRSVNHHTVKEVFNGYWRLAHEEYEFFRNGLVPVDIFTGWMLLAYAQMAGEINFQYFAADGTVMELNSRERFESVVMNGRYRHHPEFCAFVTGLYRLKARGSVADILEPEVRYEIVARYIRDYVRRHGIRTIV